MSDVIRYNPIIPSFDKKLDDSRDLDVLLDSQNKPITEDDEEPASKRSLAQVLKDIINQIGGSITVPRHASRTTEYGAATKELYGHMMAGTGLKIRNNYPGIVDVIYGDEEETACEGNDERLSDKREIKNGLKIKTTASQTDLGDNDVFDGSQEGKTLSYNSVGAPPKIHSSSNRTLYGAATGSLYGHVKLSDTYDTIEQNADAANAIGASANALQNAYKENADSISNIFNILNKAPELIYDETRSTGGQEVFLLEANKWYIVTYSSTNSDYNGICLGCSFSPSGSVPSFLFCIKGTMPINEVQGEQIPFLRIESGYFYRTDLRSSGASTRVKIYEW